VERYERGGPGGERGGIDVERREGKTDAFRLPPSDLKSLKSVSVAGRTGGGERAAGKEKNVAREGKGKGRSGEIKEVNPMTAGEFSFVPPRLREEKKAPER